MTPPADRHPLAAPTRGDAPTRFQAAVLIGRFQFFHDGHQALLERALASAPTVVVVLGAAFAARSTKNPFTWRERASMVRLAAGDQADRIRFLPVRDYPDDERWVSAVAKGVGELVPDALDIVLIGHYKDATSYYLNHFPSYHVADVGLQGEVDSAALRRVLFSGASLPGVLAALEEHVPPPVLDFLHGWAQLPFLAALTADWQAIRAEREKWAGAPYTPFFVTADAVVRCAGHVLLVRRARNPGAGLLALPGGFVEPDERHVQAARRELIEETGLGVLQAALDRAYRGHQDFDHPQRSARGRTITHAHFFDLDADTLPSVSPGDDAAEVHWVPIDDLVSLESSLFEDHFTILDHFLKIVR